MMKIYRIFWQSLLLLHMQLFFTNIVMAAEQQALETVSQVDLNRYLGTWYEIARLPNWFQDQCVADVTANYERLGDGKIEVVNRCMDEKGAMDEAHGVARVVDTSTNAKLEVSFVSVFGWRLFWGDYWILDLGVDYEYVVVGMPSRKYAWILSRSTQLSPTVWARVRQVLLRSGYDPDKFLNTRHDAMPR